jgi:molybdopterin molybdotransferase
MMSFHEALSIVLNRTPRLGKERVKLAVAAGRTLYEDLVAGHPLPPFDQCTRDGFAIASQSSTGATANSPVKLTISGEAFAGIPYEGTRRADRAVQVATGSMLPEGTDSVVPAEKVKESDGAVFLTQEIRPGQGVRRKGDDFAEGAVVIQAGSVLHARHLGLLAAFGVPRPRVARQPSVRILATGTELVEPGDEPLEAQIPLSTSFTLEGLARDAGGIPELCGIVPDKKKQLRKRIKEHLSSDILVTTGGVSSGRRDLVPAVLSELGAEILIHGVQMRPGSPVLVALHNGTMIFSLPGNPASTVVTFLELVRPAIWTMLGNRETSPQRIVGIMEHEFSKKDSRRQFVFAHCTHRDGCCMVSVRGSQDAGFQSTLASANCLMVIPEHVTRLMANDPVEIEFL